MTVPSLIDQWFPAQKIGAESLRERGSAKAFPPVNFIHVWWARRPLSASRAAVLGSVLPAWPTAEDAAGDSVAARVFDGLQAEFGSEQEYHDWFLQTVGIPKGADPAAAKKALAVANAEGLKLKGNGYGYDRAFTRSPQPEEIARLRRLAALRAPSDKAPVVLDLFAGGGSIPFESMRLGLDTVANELNPVASAILQGTLGVVRDFGPDLADDIKAWGQRWASAVEAKLGAYFPADPGTKITGYIWAFAVPCPSTGRPTPLAPNLWLSKGGTAEAALRLVVTEDRLTTEVVEGNMAAHYGDRSTYKNGVGESMWDRTTFSGEYIQEKARAGNGSYMLLALAVDDGRKRYFRPPTDADLDAAEAASNRLDAARPAWEIDGLVPDEPIEPGHKTDEMLRMGIRLWSDAFLPRQLLANLTLLEELLALQPRMLRDLGEERGKAVALHLAFALDRALNYNSRLTMWHPNAAMIANTFARHDFAFSWTCGEFEAARALVPWLVDHAGRNTRTSASWSMATRQPSTATGCSAASMCCAEAPPASPSPTAASTPSSPTRRTTTTSCTAS